jgi:hypothetical protein
VRDHRNHALGFPWIVQLARGSPAHLEGCGMKQTFALYELLGGRMHHFSNFETKGEATRCARKELKGRRWVVVQEKWVATDEVTNAEMVA